MQSFCKTLYSALKTAQKEKNEHNTLSLSHNMNARALQLIDVPEPIRSMVMSTSDPYVPPSIVNHNLISGEVQHVVRVIPETKTRIDIYFMSGEHCLPIDVPRACDIIEMYVRVIEKLTQVRYDTVQIALLPTKHEKMMDMEQPVVLGRTHVNTGVTTKYANGYSFIFVYRYEEFFKVILHELLHLYDFDYHETPQIASNYADIAHKYKVDSVRKFGLNETYNDALTIAIYLAFFIAYKRPQYMTSLESFQDCYRSNFVQAQKYIIKVSAKLLAYNERHFSGRAKEESHVFAYYHAKAALFSNSRKMFTVFKTNKMAIANDEGKIVRFANTVRNCMKSKAYKDRIALAKMQLQNSSPFFMRTLRMCNYDLEKN